MTQQNRSTLKGYFLRGNKPTQEQFENLLDSVFIQGSDTTSAANNDGVTAARGELAVQSLNFYQLKKDNQPETVWTVKQNGDCLLIGNAKDTRLVIDQATGNVGIGTNSPDYKLDVKGMIRIQGTNALIIQGSANTDEAKKSLDTLSNSSLIVGGCWDDAIFFYWKDQAGRKFRGTISGTTL